jgi:hypothetical protein
MSPFDSFDGEKIKKLFTTGPWLAIIAFSLYVDLYLVFDPTLSFSNINSAARFLFLTGIAIIFLRILSYPVHLIMIGVDSLMKQRIYDFIIGNTDYQKEHQRMLSESELRNFALLKNNTIAMDLVVENEKKQSNRENASSLQAYCALLLLLDIVFKGGCYKLINTSEELQGIAPILIGVLSFAYLYCNYKAMVPSRNSSYIMVDYEVKREIMRRVKE